MLKKDTRLFPESKLPIHQVIFLDEAVIFVNTSFCLTLVFDASMKNNHLTIGNCNIEFF
jgi:hypothetical protein